MSDADTTVANLRRMVGQFVDERDWSQFHSPKNLSMSIAIEAAELMEHFQWVDVDESRTLGASSEQAPQIREELADILCYALSLANVLDIDVASAVLDKIAKNAKKYPTERFRGRFR
jgi:NTP pyrophosphatase (non-canonical NTP hydrolase)